MTLTGAQIWEALSNESGFLEQIPDQAHPVWQELCEASAPVLEPLAELPVTAENFVQVKLAILTLLHEGGWMQKIMEAYPEEYFPLGMKDMFMGMAEMLSGLMAELGSIIGKVDETLAAQGMDEESFLMHPKGGRFALSTGVLWKEGGFTIGDLATTQPSTFFNNN